jgi:hypothetical protein
MRQARRLLFITLIAVLTSLVFFAAGCGDDDEDGNGAAPTATGAAGETPMETPPEAGVIQVNLTEWIVAPEPESAPAGSITFNAMNIGGTDHELVIIRTDLESDALPTNEDGSVDELGEGIEVLGEIPEFARGGAESITLDLEAGAYALICNVVDDVDGEPRSHYEEGMFTDFEVE